MEPTPNDRVEPDEQVGTPIYDQLVEDMTNYQPAPPARPVAMLGPDGDPKVGTP